MIDRVSSSKTPLQAEKVEKINRSKVLGETPDSITGCELYTKSGVALTLGILPFGIAYVGKQVIAGAISVAQKIDFYPVRILMGIPALIGGLFFFGGAMIFTLAQQLVWSRELVLHPQEERANTKLARYGAGWGPIYDFKALFLAFFSPWSDISSLSLEVLKD